jgi:AraC-like DNA-binding protein
VKGLDAGADAYVEKPFSMETLRARIQNLIESREKIRDQYRDEMVMRPSDVSVTPEEEAFYEEARGVVEEHIDDSGFTTEQFAGELSVSRSTLRRRLKDAISKTPAEFVRHLRLERAAQLLEEDPELRVYEVADAVGYESPDHFGRLFRERFDISLSEYPAEEIVWSHPERRSAHRETHRFRVPGWVFHVPPVPVQCHSSVSRRGFNYSPVEAFACSRRGGGCRLH